MPHVKKNKMKKNTLLAVLFIVILIITVEACKKDKSAPETEPVVTESIITYDNDNPSTTLTSIAFGSCFFQQAFSPTIFSYIQQKNPELYVALGDNIYSDDYSGDLHLDDWYDYLTMRYSQLGDSVVFQNFQANVPILAIWDDHDFGMNNAAGDFVNKDISKDVFFNFWNLSKSGKRWERNGIYDSYYYGDADHRVQVILLDLRWDLDSPGVEPLVTLTDTTKKMMSNEQWSWLKEELLKPAKIRIIGSVTQFCTEQNGWETWANFPHEQERMYQTLKDAQAEGVFFISGDVHMAEVNKRTPTDLYPLYDFTASGLAHLHGNNARASQYRQGDYVDRDNFGMIDINWAGDSSTVDFTVFDSIGIQVLTKSIVMSELTF